MTERFPTFAEFFDAATGKPAYAWQLMCAAEVEASGWRDTIDVPTGLGKTSCIHVAVYELARQLHFGVPRTAPLRIYHVIDRNTVVQQSAAGVEQLTDAINSADDGPLGVVRAALERALPTYRPGSAISRAWYDGTRREGGPLRAAGCTITSMTAHQFVSRLLFRGFGVGSGSRSIEAGLVGVDSLIFLDEPHLSRPTVTTVTDAVALQQQSTETVAPPLKLVTLGATVGPRSAAELGDRSSLFASVEDDPLTARRIAGVRNLTLSPLSAKSESQFATAMIRRAKELIGDDVSIGVIVNTIVLAQLVTTGLQRAGLSVDILTSRTRPMDKRGLLADAADRRGRILVATQCIEVGVDISFDVLITEACPMPSLIQRIGRLNRDGLGVGEGYLVSSESGVRDGSAAVYGAASIATTMGHLANVAVNGVIDASLVAQRSWPADDPGVWPDVERHATLTPATIPYMTLTNPRLPSDLDVDAFIHGPDAAPSAEVRIAWRDDLDLLSDCPPQDGEFVTLPIGAARAFLRGVRKPLADLSDAGGGLAANTERPTSDRPVAKIRAGSGEWTDARDTVLPGSDIVVHTASGGYSVLGWDPASNDVVPDLAAEAASASQTRAAFPVSAAVLDAILDRNSIAEVLGAAVEDLDLADPSVRLAMLDALNSALHGNGSTITVDRIIEGSVGRPVAQINTRAAGRESTARGLLDHHLNQVCLWGHGDAQAVGLSASLVEAVALAGLWHDCGKATAVWQRLANGGTVPSEPEAGFTRSIAAGRFRAYAHGVGFPLGWRHEAHTFHSLDALDIAPLVKHLAASHHGWFRPFCPAIDPHAAPLTPDEMESHAYGADHATEFNLLNREYGPWGLAYLEAVLRLADHRAAAHPEKVTIDDVPVDTTSPKVSVPVPASTADEFVLSGLVSSPTTGWFAVLGLLGAASRLGVDARVRWEAPSDDDRRPLIPRLRCSAALADLVYEIWNSDDLAAADLVTKNMTGKELSAKYQKLTGVGTIRELLLQDQGSRFLTGLINDATAAAADKLELSSSALSNNSSYSAVALGALKRSPEEGLKALLDPTAGFTVANADGGFDRNGAEQPLVNGIGDSGKRSTRTALAPLVLEGFAALGTPPSRGHGVANRRLSLPLPSRFTELAALRVLTYIGRPIGQNGYWSSIGCNWFLTAAHEKVTPYDAHWRVSIVDTASQPN